MVERSREWYLPVVLTQTDEKLADRSKDVLCVGVVGQTLNAWFIRTNERNELMNFNLKMIVFCAVLCLKSLSRNLDRIP